MNAWQATVIKGNTAEIGALSNSSEVSGVIPASTPTHSFTVFWFHVLKVQSKGVDSAGSGFMDPASVVRSLALKEREWQSNSDLPGLLTYPFWNI